MMLRDFRIGWRLLLQQPAYSLVVIGGLAVGFAACFLLFGYVAFCLNYNSSIPDSERVAVIKQRINLFPRPDWQLVAFLPLRAVAQESGMVSAASIVKVIDKPMRVDGQLHTVPLQAVDPAFSDIFGITALQGNLHAALTQPDGLALTKTAAASLFGTRMALGRQVYIEDTVLQVRSVLPDPPANSTEQYQALVGANSNAWTERHTAFEKWDRGLVYMKLRPGASIPDLTALLQAASERSPLHQFIKQGPMGSGLNGRNVSDIRLLPLHEAYFDTDMASSRRNAGYGKRSSVFGLAAGGMLILLLATINYVNLATIRTLQRQREIGLRKLLGASAGQLIRQFLSEAILAALLAAMLGLILAWLLLPTFSDLVNRPLSRMFTLQHCAAAIGFSLLAGIAAGAYPAWRALHALPATALTGRASSETHAGLWLRRILTILQFGSAMALGAAAVTVAWQTWYASHASPGFDPRNLLVLEMPSSAQGKPAADAFIGQLSRLAGIAAVATMSEAVGRDGVKIIDTIRTREGQEIRLETKHVSPNWFDVIRQRALFGATFNPALDPHDDQDTGGVMLNTAAALQLGFASPQAAVGKTLPDGTRIIGIAPEIRFQGLHEAPKALVYRVRPDTKVMVRTGMPVEQAYRVFDPVWRRNFPNEVLNVQTQEAVLAERYAEEARLMRILAISSAIAIALAAFGIYVLSAYSVLRGRREIVMRRLHGAGGMDIALRLAREFAMLVGAGAVIGLPVAAVATRRYLANYTEHAPIGGWPVIAALLLATLVAILATARHTIAALRMRPIQALKD